MKDTQAAEVAKALSHPLRIALVRTLQGRRDLSPTDYATETGEALGNVSYHVRALEQAEVITQVGQFARRGALEHRYALKGRRAKTAIAILDLLKSP